RKETILHLTRRAHVILVDVNRGPRRPSMKSGGVSLGIASNDNRGLDPALSRLGRNTLVFPRRQHVGKQLRLLDQVLVEQFAQRASWNAVVNDRGFARL